jgi:hypothetical protein
MDIEVFVEGVSDVKVTKDIKHRLQQVCKTIYRCGDWSVLVAPSEDARGQWDLGVRGPFGQRVVSFSTDVEQLPVQVAEQLRACF